MKAHKVLIIDDETDFAEYVADVAEGVGCDVRWTDDPTAFATLYTNDIDIVVLDLFMPEMDGIEILRFLSDNRSAVSVVFVSGKDKSVLNSARELAGERGIPVLGVLEKPFLATELEVLLAAYTPRSAGDPGGTAELPSVEDLQRAIVDGELFLAYQPQIALTNSRPVGVEALARWNHPTKGSIPPNHFVPLAEDGDLIDDLTQHVAGIAIRQQGDWRRQGIDLRVSINMSPKVLDNVDMPELLAHQVANAGSDVSKIVIEVTETALMRDLASYMDILTRLRMKGFGISIDDFGTGYSSLQQLVRVPFTELKIDRAFIQNLDSDQECRTIAEITILLAHKLGMKTVAEGIETEAIWNLLGELGCDEGQGFWMGRPMAATDLEQWLREWGREA